MKKSGTETPSWLTTRAAPSTQVSWRTAASTPSGNAITTPMIMAVTASESVAGNRWRRIWVTGCPVWKLTPRLPVSAWPR